MVLGVSVRFWGAHALQMSRLGLTGAEIRALFLLSKGEDELSTSLESSLPQGDRKCGAIL